MEKKNTEAKKEKGGKRKMFVWFQVIRKKDYRV